jgi:hypothetical protein
MSCRQELGTTSRLKGLTLCIGLQEVAMRRITITSVNTETVDLGVILRSEVTKNLVDTESRRDSSLRSE